ncbi:ABC transporter ATP-binding protein [Bordetella genomosp. 13]|uniref:ABC transporter ATP-binding protein n=1 Tax=Bordetella genomosp. 13 TaxID=463040 RepID=UPI0011A1B1C9|nr:ABC transporter ATP-binding protein [Bordetella genomosp. 13]
MSTAPPPVLRVEQLSVAYRGAAPVLRDLDLNLAAGEVVGLIGETGSGKTTLARAILGLVRPQQGRIWFQDRDISSLAPRHLRKFRRSGSIQYVFQDPLQSLDPDFTIFESLAEGLRVAGITAADVLRKAVEDALADVQLTADFADHYPAEISGGQRQRVVIARALIRKPAMLILDEPVSALDASNRIKLLKLFKDLSAGRGITQLFISHDLGSVAGISDRIVVLYRGRIVESGTPAQVLNDPQHPYTRLLVRSAPSIVRAGADRDTRRQLHDALARLD